jgi:hypothetical protein
VPGLKDRLKHAWNAFVDEDVNQTFRAYGEGVSYSRRPDRVQLRFTNERSIIASIMTRIAIDCAALDIRHIRRDENERYVEDMKSGLQTCLTLKANLDQPARMFRQDSFMSMMDEGVAAIVPVETDVNPNLTGGYEIRSLRVGKVVGWHPRQVRVRLYNDRKGTQEELTLDKSIVALVENPLLAVMNEPNSTLQRLIKTLNHLDAVDEASASGRLDLIIQLPYVVKSPSRQKQAEQRRKDIETQLKGSAYGIAYTDGTEKITQLNRPTENNLLKQVEFLTKMLYSQLGLTEEVMNGTADEKTMINYYNRTVKPITDAFVEAMRCKFLTKTALSQGQWIKAYRDPLSTVPIKDLAEISDKFRRGEIATPNDFRDVLGWKPMASPSADDPRNTNMPAPSEPNQQTPIE